MTGGARGLREERGPALEGAAGVGLGAGGSCGEQSGTGATGREEGISVQTPAPGEADAHRASPALGTRSQ